MSGLEFEISYVTLFFCASGHKACILLCDSNFDHLMKWDVQIYSLQVIFYPILIRNPY